MKDLILLLLFVFLFSSCPDQRHEELQQKELQLKEIEQQLILREQEIQLKEEELAKKQILIDSASLNDSAFIYNPLLIGKWNVKMVCTETTCPGSAVGDTKNETWQISYESKNIVARAMSRGEVVRVYSGIYTGNTLELIEDRQETPSQPSARMIVRLRITGENTMEGQREIIREDCKIIYSLNLIRQ